MLRPYSTQRSSAASACPLFHKGKEKIILMQNRRDAPILHENYLFDCLLAARYAQFVYVLPGKGVFMSHFGLETRIY